jgi:hypothetical protein
MNPYANIAYRQTDANGLILYYLPNLPQLKTQITRLYMAQRIQKFFITHKQFSLADGMEQSQI